ncbi:hypothetical protein D9615_000538 [Tricholomella constricta]|uniref:Small ribosomal subunit protein bS18m n=1 Tax=Tricholomella constricta TaxID=117010 RepID=A0A8H5MCB9_9AGAR|nr:hypothetical protein D9615_000538 [Tricholomella constricta]
MLTLLRHVGRRSAAAVRPILAANYSAEASPTDSWGTVTEVLMQEGDKQATPPPQKAFAAPNTGLRRGQAPATKWKAFQPSRFVKPHELTYKARFNAPRTYMPRRAAVGPPPAIARYNDVFHQFDIDPLSQAMNPEILSHYMSEMGKIYGRNITGLTSKSQRRIGKAIRRAKMMGIIPVLSRTQGLYSQYKPKTRKT